MTSNIGMIPATDRPTDRPNTCMEKRIYRKTSDGMVGAMIWGTGEQVLNWWIK